MYALYPLVVVNDVLTECKVKLEIPATVLFVSNEYFLGNVFSTNEQEK